MQRTTALALLSVLSALPVHARPERVHALVVADTLDNTKHAVKIGDGVKQNVADVTAWLKQMDDGAVGRLEVKLTMLVGSQYDCERLDAAVVAFTKQNAIESDESVIFYYAGHGFREEGTPTDLPLLQCGGDEKRPDGRDLANVVAALKATKARLVLVAADACNNLIKVPGVTRKGLEQADDIGLRHLMLEFTGSVILVGSRPKEFSWYNSDTSNPEGLGGYFTKQFLFEAFYPETQKGLDASWAGVSNIATQEITILGSFGRIGTQRPFQAE